MSGNQTLPTQVIQTTNIYPHIHYRHAKSLNYNNNMVVQRWCPSNRHIRTLNNVQIKILPKAQAMVVTGCPCLQSLQTGGLFWVPLGPLPRGWNQVVSRGFHPNRPGLAWIRTQWDCQKLVPGFELLVRLSMMLQHFWRALYPSPGPTRPLGSG